MLGKAAENIRYGHREITLEKPVVFSTVTLCTFLTLFLMHIHLGHAATIEEIEASGRYLMGDRDSKLDGRRLALQEAKRNALEQAGTYIESFTEVKNAQLSQDLIRSYTAGIVEVREMDEKAEMVGQSLAITIRVKARVDRDVVVRQIEFLRKDRETQRDLEAARKKIQQYEQQVAALSRELHTVKGVTQPRIAEVQESRNQALTQIDVQTLLIKARVAAIGTEAERVVRIGSISKGKLARAREYVEQALQIAPDNSEVLASMGEILLHEKEPYKAEGFFRNALRLKPDDARWHAYLASTLLVQKKFDGAYQAAQQTLKLNPDDLRAAGAHSVLGSIYRERGELAAAIREYREAIHLEPDAASFHVSLSATLAKQGDLAGAVLAAREAVRLEPTTALYHANLSAALAKQGDVAGVGREAREAVRLDPELGFGHHQLGYFLLRQGDQTGARQELQSACQLGFANGCQALKDLDTPPLVRLVRGCGTRSAAVDHNHHYAAIDIDAVALLYLGCHFLLTRWKRRRPRAR